MLTVKQIDAAMPKEKPYRLLDGNRLYLYVPESGKSSGNCDIRSMIKRKY